MTKSRYIFAGLAVAILAVLAWGFFAGGWQQIKNFVSRQEAVPAGKVAGAAERQGLYAVSARSVTSPILSLTQNTVWYFDDLGQLFRSKFDGSEEQAFTLKDPKPAREVLWPLLGNDFIERLPRTSGGDSFRLYRASTEAFLDLPSALDRLAWLADGKRVVYVWRRGDGGRELKLADADTTNYTKVADISESYFLRPAPSGDYVLLIAPVAAQSHPILKLDLARGTITTLVDNGLNLDANIAPDGKRFLFSRVNDQSGQAELWLYDLGSGQAQPLNIRTSCEKTVWDAASGGFYYAIPESVASSDPLMKAKSKDKIFFFSLATSQSAALPYAFDSLRLDVRDLLLAPAKILFFRNGWDGRLYRMDLE